MNKKLLIAIIAGALVLVGVVVGIIFITPNDNANETPTITTTTTQPHIHTEVVDNAVESTCMQVGLTEGKHCSTCNEIILAQEEVPMKAHTEVTIPAVAATCISTGLTEGKKCSVCETITLAQTEISKIAHTEVTIPAVAATCTSTGLTEGKKCSVCSTVMLAQTTIDKIDHNYVNESILTEATCLASGTKKFTCDKCSDYITESYEKTKYTATEINNQALQYVGEITVYDKQGEKLGLGTAFVISSDGKVVTNYHVIEDVYLAEIIINGTKYDVEQVLAYDKNIDLAILKIDATDIPYATVCAEEIAVGSTVYAIGSSRGLTNTFSSGMVTYYNRVVDGVSHVQHDASITNGNSGGPLINEYGEVVGINTWGLIDSQNLNFAVFTKELDNLVYGEPMTLAELYEKNLSPYEILVDWVWENYNDTGESWIEYRYQESGERFSVYTLTYFYNSKTLNLVYYYVFNNGDARYVSIELSEDMSYCEYYASYTDGDYSYMRNETLGYIYPSSFNRNTSIEYYSSEGDYWTISSLLSTYQEGIVYSLDWFEIFLDAFDFGFTLSDLGFKSFS